MAEPEPTRSPSTPPPDTISRDSARSFDVRAVEGTASYPVNPTVTFPGPADPASQPPTVSDHGNETAGAPDLPRIPGYRVFRVVAQGGMGTVFEALHIATNRVVALKIINAGWANDNDFRARFAREVHTLAALEHENIVSVYDAGSWQGLPFLTMKFIAGKTLAHHLSALRRDLPAAARLLAQVARAVQYLHANGIVHRDLKPLNILITPEGKPLVADFGLVRPLDDDSELSMTHIPMGTRQYMSPEQTRGGRANYTPACDIWALGIVLYELLAGRRPFDHDDTVILFHQIRTEPAPPIPPEMNAPPSLEAIAQRCLEKAPADRYASAGDIANDLERWLAGEVIPPPPPPARRVEGSTPPPKPSRPVRMLAGGAALVLLAGLAASAGGLFRDRTQNPPDGPPDTNTAPPVTKSVAERLRAGETVVLIGEKGQPLVPHSAVAPFPGRLFVHADGYCALDSANYDFVQLLDEELPCPVRVKAEIAFRPHDFKLDLAVPPPHHESWAGIFVGLKETPTTIPHRSCLTLQHSVQARPTDARVELLDVCRLGTGYWWPARRTPIFSELESKSARSEIQIAEGNLRRWRDFSFELTPDKATAEWAKQQFKPFTSEDMLIDLRDLSDRNRSPNPPPAFAPPAYGRGLGICVHKAEATYRNVKLVPLP